MSPIGHIPFSRPLLLGSEGSCINSMLSGGYFAGDGPMTLRCQRLLEEQTEARKALLTPSCTHALELAALLSQISPGDEVIVPSFAFSSTANAFVMQGAVPVFADVCAEDMNINPDLLEAALSSRTRAVVALHYGGMACDMKALTAFAERHQLLLIEDAAQALGASYDHKPLGSFGQLATISFHETKNVHCGEGGCLLINAEEMTLRVNEMRDKGTNKRDFLAGKVSAYEWTSRGSSYLMSEVSAAFLHAQLQALERVNAHRRKLWEAYAKWLQPLENEGLLHLPHPQKEARHNGHLFFIRCRTQKERDALSRYLAEKNIGAYFHYTPLHLSPAGKKYGRTAGGGPLPITERESRRLLRLPLYYDLSEQELAWVARKVFDFFGVSAAFDLPENN